MALDVLRLRDVFLLPQRSRRRRFCSKERQKELSAVLSPQPTATLRLPSRDFSIPEFV